MSSYLLIRIINKKKYEEWMVFIRSLSQKEKKL